MIGPRKILNSRILLQTFAYHCVIMKVSVEPASKDDLSVFNEISFSSKSYWGYPEDWLNSWEEDLTVSEEDLNENTAFKLLVDNKTAGFCVIKSNSNYFEINHLWVVPKYIGWGYGKILLEESIKRSVKKPCKIKVESDPNAEGFYKKYGFKTIDKIESYPKGRYLPVMEKIVN